ncbi:MAG: hypothetical protein ACYDC3_11090 [Candidatus Binataceae bacterium]
MPRFAIRERREIQQNRGVSAKKRGLVDACTEVFLGAKESGVSRPRLEMKAAELAVDLDDAVHRRPPSDGEIIRIDFPCWFIAASIAHGGKSDKAELFSLVF